MNTQERNKLIEEHIHLAQVMANKWSKGRRDRYDDMYQVACLALVTAAHSYTDTSLPFPSYATTIISRDLSKWCTDNASVLSSPKSKSDRRNKILQKLNSLSYDVTHNDLIDIADAMNVSQEDVISIYNGMLYNCSNNIDVDVMLAIDDDVEKIDLFRHIVAYLSGVDATVREVFQEFLSGSPVSSIEKKTGLSRSRVYEMLKSSIEELRRGYN